MDNTEEIEHDLEEVCSCVVPYSDRYVCVPDFSDVCVCADDFSDVWVCADDKVCIPPKPKREVAREKDLDLDKKYSGKSAEDILRI